MRPMPIMRVAERAVAKLTANRLAQYLLTQTVRICQYFRGYGSGSFVERSGEIDFLRNLRSYRYPRIFDVGANVGIFTLAASRILPSAVIHVFEPDAYAFTRLWKNCSDLRKVTCINEGVGKSEGIAKLYSAEIASALASTFPQKGISRDISITTIDSYCHRHKIWDITLLKIDVEGDEMNVLEGAQELMYSGRIDMVMFELGIGSIYRRNYLLDFCKFFEKYNFNLFRLTPGGYLSPVKWEDSAEIFTTTNYVAIRRKRWQQASNH